MTVPSPLGVNSSRTKETMKSDIHWKGITVIAASLLLTRTASAQYAIDWHSIGPAGSSAGGDYSVNGAISQPTAGAVVAGGDFSLTGGFWSGAAAGANSTTVIVPGTANPWLA